MKSICSAILVLLPVFSVAQEQTMTPEEVRQSNIDLYEASVFRNKNKPNVARLEYYKDSSMPYGIAFRNFLLGMPDLTELSREEAVHDIVDDFRLSHDEAGDKMAGSLFDVFVASADALDFEIRDMEAKQLCSEARRSRTKEETYVVFDDVDDRRHEIAGDHFRKIRTELSDEEYSVLVNYLDDLKLRSYYRTYDHAAAYSLKPKRDIRDRAEEVCAERFLTR